jgi:hypothetical protein
MIEKVERDKRYKDERLNEITCKTKYFKERLKDETQLGKRLQLDFDEIGSIKNSIESGIIPAVIRGADFDSENSLLLKKELKYLKSRMHHLKSMQEWRQDQDAYLYKRSSDILISSKSANNQVLQKLSELYESMAEH